jgi:putative transposase
LRGVKLVISDAHERLKAAIRQVFGAGWQRCRVHWMRNALAYVLKTQQSMVAAALRQAFLQPDRAKASAMLRHVADLLRPKWPKLAAFIDDSEIDVPSYLDLPEQHRSKLHSTNSPERLKKEVKRRANVVGIFPNEAAIIRLIGAVLLEQNDEWQLQRHAFGESAVFEAPLCCTRSRRRALARHPDHRVRAASTEGNPLPDRSGLYCARCPSNRRSGHQTPNLVTSNDRT